MSRRWITADEVQVGMRLLGYFDDEARRLPDPSTYVHPNDDCLWVRVEEITTTSLMQTGKRVRCVKVYDPQTRKIRDLGFLDGYMWLLDDEQQERPSPAVSSVWNGTCPHCGRGTYIGLFKTEHEGGPCA